MKFIETIVVTFLFLTSTYSQAQVEANDYSIGQAALIIDSLENNLTTSENHINLNTIYRLTILYKQIDLQQSKKYALKYLSLIDSSSSISNRNDIYEVLSYVYEKQNYSDSALYFLALRASFLDKSFEENNEILRLQYLNGKMKNRENIKIFGITQTQIILLTVLLLILVVTFFYSKNLKKKLNKIKAKKNYELEEANTKLKEFNNSVKQAVINNTNEIAIQLEKSNSNIVELRKALKKAEESNYLKNKFLGSMSHKIRTPLSGIMGFSDMLETELAVMGNEELFDYAKNIRESGEKLMNLITHIFDISNIEANILELNIESCDINEIISAVEKVSLIKAKEKGLIFKSKLDADIPKINADINNINKVLNIVIDNAIRYSKKGFVTISSIKNNNNTVTIRVADKGAGIAKDKLKMIIDSFNYKKHGSSLTYKNNGLGLILAHRLVELMKGKLEITSQINMGTEVCITLPGIGNISNNKDANIDNSTSIISAPELGRVKIFIVEDDRMNRLVLEKMLKKSGEIVTATDGVDTLKKIEKSTKSGKLFDVMLFDINLPQPWDGIKLMHEIKKRFPAYKNIPFIAQTAYAMAYDKDTYLDAGFNDYIAKPIIKTELLTIIQKQLELFK